MIARETVDEVLMRTDIQSLIGNYVSLKRAGSTYKGLCPFHSEKTPSFVVYPADNSFYCFGCGIGGNAITFARQIEHLDYQDAIEFLAKRAGISVVRDERKDPYGSGEKRFDKERLYAMNVDAAKYFHRCLFSVDPKAKAALAYFTEKRGLSVATIRHFGLGFAPDSFDAFSTFMRSRGYTYDELVAGFLCGKSESGRYYDAFRNRVMFPIIDVTGRVIAFGGRVMDDSKPKYKNSSDTPVFKKSRNLFALNFARLTCTEQMILCEGYMDVIALHAAGFTNAVATLGTAITDEQARVMSRYTKQVVISYDADEAGQKAAQRATKMLEDVGLNVSVLMIPGAKDPDEYIKTYGKEKFAEVLGGSKDKFDFRVETILKKYDIHIPRDRIRAIDEIEDVISRIYSATERSICISLIATRFSVARGEIEADVKKKIALNARRARRSESEAARRSLSGYTDRVNPDFIRAPDVANHEQTVLGLMLLYPEHRRTVCEKGLLSRDDFFTSLGKRVFDYLLACERDDGAAGDINEVFSTEEVGRITKMKIARMELSDNGDEVLRESIEGLKNAMRKKTAGQVENPEDLSRLIRELRDRDEEKKEKES